MGFPAKIQLALEQYNHRKECAKHRFDDHPAVQAILNIPDTDKQDPVYLYQCFNKNNEPALSQASFQVYLSILNYSLASLGLISDKKATVYPKSLEYLDPAFLSVKQETESENNLWVGLLHWDTYNKQTLLIEERHALLKTAVESLEKQANGKQYLLVAPEYFYSRPLADSFETHIQEVNHKHHSINYLTDKTYSNFYEKDKHYPPGSIRQIEEDSYKKILFFLKNLSSQHPNLILFPGTISYLEKIKKEHKNLFILEKRIEENLENISFHNCGASLLFYNFNFKAYFLDKKKEDKIQCFKKFKYVAKNTAPCFYQGKKLFSQNKVYNFSEITEGYPKVGRKIDLYTKKLPEIFFLPGVYQGEVGKINDLSFAIDICADHPRLFLKKSLEKKKNPSLYIFVNLLM